MKVKSEYLLESQNFQVGIGFLLLKSIYSERATKFCKIFPVLLTTVFTVKSKGKISQKFCGLLRIYELYPLGYQVVDQVRKSVHEKK